MRTPGDKKATTLRLAPGTKQMLETAARIKRSSESAIADLAIQEWCKERGIGSTRYMLGIGPTCYVLFKAEGDTVTVLEQDLRNGASVEDLRGNYQAKYQAPIDLLVEKD